MKGADPRIAAPDGHAFQESSDNVFLPPAKQEQQDPDPDPQPQPTGPRTGAYSDSTANYTINADGTATYKGPKKDQATVTVPEAGLGEREKRTSSPSTVAMPCVPGWVLLR